MGLTVVTGDGDGDGDGDYQLSPVVDHREFVCLECHPCAVQGLVWRWNQGHFFDSRFM